MITLTLKTNQHVLEENVKSYNVNWPDFNLPPINLYSFSVEDSPCIGKCKLSEGKCTGCKRTIQEISSWSIMTPKERLDVLKDLENRKNTW